MKHELLLLTMTSGAWLSMASASMASSRFWTDPANDAMHRPSDNGLFRSFFDNVTPDVLSVTLQAWSTPTPATNPYNGAEANAAGADLFRLDLVFNGLVNPPGELGLGNYDPDRFGDRPVYGFLEIDVDNSLDTGGELPEVARLRYLANGGRFGGVPTGSIGLRAARSSFDLDEQFFSGPQYERSGAEFALSLCGCFDPVIVSQDGDMDSVFDSGETWVVRGRFFERFQAIRLYSIFEGGSNIGLWDPEVNLRFSHNAALNRTTVTLVYALTMQGAADLAGDPVVQLANETIDDHTSVAEALQETIDTADFGGIFEQEISALVDGWSGRTPEPYLDPSQWDVTGIFGTAYVSLGSALYVWTDVGFEWRFGDFNADGLATGADRALLLDEIALKDGGVEDGDGIVNGSVTLQAFADAFSVFDLNYDGLVNSADVTKFDAEASPAGDLDGDGVVNGEDLALLLAAWGSSSPVADINGDGTVDGPDLAALLSTWTN